MYFIKQQFTQKITPKAFALRVCRACVPLQRGLLHSYSSQSDQNDQKVKHEPFNLADKTKADALRGEEKKKKTQAELDKELQLKMQGISGDGGDAGIELEDGQPVAMKRSVRNNMFRYI